MHVLVNWLWQGSAIALLAGTALRATRVSATVRHFVWWITLALVLALPAFPALLALSGAPAPPPDAAATLAVLPTRVMSDSPVTILLAAWATWVACMLILMLRSLASLVRARRHAAPFPAAREARLPLWNAACATGRRARLVSSDRVSSAAVLGLGDALIAVSPAAAAHLTDEELDQVLLHEWAHVQRRDDIARLVQLVVHAFAGFHPAAWWIDRRIEIDREIACDDRTIRTTRQPRRFARCLVKIAELPLRGGHAMPLAAVLVRSQLTLRVDHLLDPQRDTTTERVGSLTSLLAAAMLVAAVLVSRLELVVAAMPLPVLPDIPRAVSPAQSQVVTPPRADADDAATLPGSSPESGERRDPIPPPSNPAERTPQAGSRVVPAPAAAPAVRGPDLAPIERSAVAWLPDLTSAAGAPADGSSAPAPTDGSADGAAPPDPATLWGVAADAGVSLGRGSQRAATATADAGTTVGRASQKAAVATAGFFTKLSRKIAGSF